ncbi:MAG: SAM-dependent methyltransferase, partial [Anaerolineae bacterium]|nr:SAM-dependent methyltransferase [Anaerolineae bacterium]
RCISGIKKHSDLLGRYVHKYFEDVVLHVKSLATVLAHGARIHYVVGNSKFYDVLLPTEEIYAAIFDAAGFANIAIERIRKRTSKKELFEYIVHAMKP